MALGSSRGRRRPGRGSALLLAVLLLAASACAGTERPRAIQPEYDLHDPDPAVRIGAVHAAMRSGDSRRVPDLIEMLDDRDEAVRMAAIGALRSMTDHDTEYRAFAPTAERRAQVQAWRDWHASRETSPTGGAP